MYCANVPDRFSDSMVGVFLINSEIINPPSSPMKFPRSGRVMKIFDGDDIVDGLNTAQIEILKFLVADKGL